MKFANEDVPAEDAKNYSYIKLAYWRSEPTGRFRITMKSYPNSAAEIRMFWRSGKSTVENPSYMAMYPVFIACRNEHMAAALLVSYIRTLLSHPRETCRIGEVRRLMRNMRDMYRFDPGRSDKQAYVTVKIMNEPIRRLKLKRLFKCATTTMSPGHKQWCLERIAPLVGVDLNGVSSEEPLEPPEGKELLRVSKEELCGMIDRQEFL